MSQHPPMSDEVTLHARDTTKTGSKHLERFSAKRGQYKVGDVFRAPPDFDDFHCKPWQTLTPPRSRTYIVEKIDDPPE